jgi:hypothetical protein
LERIVAFSVLLVLNTNLAVSSVPRKLDAGFVPALPVNNHADPLPKEAASLQNKRPLVSCTSRRLKVLFCVIPANLTAPVVCSWAEGALVPMPTNKLPNFRESFTAYNRCPVASATQPWAEAAKVVNMPHRAISTAFLVRIFFIVYI